MPGNSARKLFGFDRCDVPCGTARNPFVVLAYIHLRALALQRTSGAGEGIRTPDRLITNQLLYRTELRQPDKERIIALPVPPEPLHAGVNPYFPGARLKTRSCTLPFV